ncbi:MAG: SbcC/MukB-like Walker B domain-containing protein [Methylobacter sp.]|uniref:SbcC/MukB-like Walker B domain-containing protein n=1 Tax=Methylobacter sp. TaxID=2051955 RepID=UPI002730315E|nr:SbcC/MukB-like Walker B domain-containing protein [Methylobacter sp.]MDP1666231.1 SbcC/MukB-like Walker B domain-containing protein [Methylobacter sp.]
MKILNIQFKNINSLEGENRIDFEQSPFSDTGVFAITGPNGSGKSSILDAITLGLYGETFRFDRPAGHVMTKHTAESFSEIEFVLDKVKYRSSWHAQRRDADPEGELTPPEMKLTRLSDDEVLATTSQQVCARITEITGMNFRNFTRSILLAQGDFAAFLNALDNERMDILEKIISADIYADYRNEINEKAADAQQRLDYLKQDLSIIPFMDPEKLEACEHDLIDFIDQTAELQEEQSNLKQQQASLHNVLTLQNRIADQEKNLQQTKALSESEQQKLNQLTMARDALLFKDDVQVIKEKNHEIHQSKAILADFRGELKQIQDHVGADKTAPDRLSHKSVTEQGQILSEIKAQIGQLSAQRQSESDLWQSLVIQIDDKTSNLANVSKWLEEHVADESLLASFPETGRLKNLRTELIELKEKQKTFTKWSKNTTASLKNNNSAIAQENKRIAELKHKLPLAKKALEELAQGKNLAELEDFRQEQQERVKDFRELYTLAVTYQKLTKSGFSFFGFFDRKEQPNHDIEELESELASLKQEISREENIKLTLEMAVFRESLLRKMAPDRQHLVDGEPCFLCGAAKHPYVEHPPKAANSQQALTDQKARIKALMTAVGKLEQQLKTTRKQAEKNQANQTEQIKINSQWQTLSNRLNTASEDLKINKPGLMQHRLKTEISALKTITAVIADYRNKQTGIDQLEALIAKGEAAVERLQLTSRQLEAEWQERPKEGIDYDAALATCQQEEQQLTDKVVAQLALLGEKMPAKGKEDALFDRLNARRQDYQSYAFRQKSLTEELEVLKAKADHCQVEITACNEKLERYNQQLQSEEIVGLHLALIEKQKLIADKEQLITRQEAELDVLKRALQDNIKGTQFTSLHELTEVLELLQHQPELERHLAELEQEIDAKTIELEKSRFELEAENTLVATQLSSEQLNAQLKSVTEKLAIADLEAQRLKRLLNEQKQLKQKADAVLVQLQDQQEVARLCKAEAAQIAEESGMAFRRRVQQRIADQLLSQTNAVLEKVSGRYYLRKIPTEQGLALEIEDTYQNNARRLPKTLSGGESFVVSLALALGLSELANSGKSVDSLFLDEGFGNLDAETLYTVISTLEGLHTHGKTVGVISHVEGVQKRFKAQLQVVKKPNGMGMLKQVS